MAVPAPAVPAALPNPVAAGIVTTPPLPAPTCKGQQSQQQQQQWLDNAAAATVIICCWLQEAGRLLIDSQARQIGLLLVNSMVAAVACCTEYQSYCCHRTHHESGPLFPPRACTSPPDCTGPTFTDTPGSWTTRSASMHSTARHSTAQLNTTQRGATCRHALFYPRPACAGAHVAQ